MSQTESKPLSRENASLEVDGSASKDPHTQAASGERGVFLSAVAIGLLALLVYLPTLQFGFVNYDDPWLIQNNRTLHQLNPESLHRIWFDLSAATRLRLGSEYLPVRDLSVMLDFALYGSWVGGHHLSNALLYGLLCGLLVLLLGAWLQRPRLAWMAGLLFALHPIHVEAVAWLSERKGLLAGVWILLAGLAFRRFAAHPKAPSLLLAGLCAILAIWSKAVSAMALPLFGVLLWLYPPATEAPALRRWAGWATLCGLGILACVPVWMAGQAVHMTQGYHGGSWSSNAWLAMGIHATYLELMFFSGGYGIQYPLAPGHVGLLRGVVGTAATLGLALVAVFGLLRRGAWSLWCLAACIWCAFLLPVSQLLFQLQNVMADRYLLLPSIGWALAVAAALELAQDRLRKLLLACICLVALVFTLFQTQTWSSSKALYRQALEIHPKNAKALIQLIRLERDPQRAMYWLRKAKQVAPEHPRVLLQEALLYLRQGRLTGAIQVLELATRHSLDDKIRANLALLLLRSKRPKQALRYAKEAANTRPMVAHNQQVLCVAALGNRSFPTAQAACQKALLLAPHQASNHRNMAVYYMGTGDPDRAKLHLKKARALARRRP